MEVPVFLRWKTRTLPKLTQGASESEVERFRQQIVQRVSPPAEEEVHQHREVMERFFGKGRDESM